MQFSRNSRKKPYAVRRLERSLLQVENLEGRTQPGSLLPFNEFSMMGAGLFGQDPLARQAETTELSRLAGLVAEQATEAPSVVSFGASAVSQPVQVSQPTPVASQPVQSASQPLWSAVNAGVAQAPPSQALSAVAIQAEAHQAEITKVVGNPFQLVNNPVITAGPTGPTPPGLGAVSYAIPDNSEAIAVASNTVTGETYVGGSVGTGVDKFAFIAKYDANGQPVWWTGLQGSDPGVTYVESQINALVVDATLGVFYAVGTARDANAGDTDQFLMQLYDNGAYPELFFGYGIGGAFDDAGNGVALDAYNFNNVYITGDFKPTATETHVSVFGLDYAGTLPPLFAFFYRFEGLLGSSGKGAAFDLYTGNVAVAGSLTPVEGESVAMVMGVNGLTGAGQGALFFNNPDGASGLGAFTSVALDNAYGGLVAVGTVPAAPSGTTGIAAKINGDFATAAWALIYGGTKGFYGVDADYYGFFYISGTVEDVTNGDEVLIGQFDAYTGEPVPDQVVTLGGAGSDVGRRLAVSYDANLLPITNVAFTTTTDNLVTSDGSVYPTGAASAAAFAALGNWF